LLNPFLFLAGLYSSPKFPSLKFGWGILISPPPPSDTWVFLVPLIFFDWVFFPPGLTPLLVANFLLVGGKPCSLFSIPGLPSQKITYPPPPFMINRTFKSIPPSVHPLPGSTSQPCRGQPPCFSFCCVFFFPYSFFHLHRKPLNSPFPFVSGPSCFPRINFFDPSFRGIGSFPCSFYMSFTFPPPFPIRPVFF